VRAEVGGGFLERLEAAIGEALLHQRIVEHGVDLARAEK
jgi:hypothetical protein